jgi:hypothetical protein
MEAGDNETEITRAERDRGRDLLYKRAKRGIREKMRKRLLLQRETGERM